ncbi:hypothetical protein RFI_24722 [Reticulomyxa filosa]|uniref:Uncharacterized protein n=1 Tax=Reticulomyxa filosa TaxID=46433 RepID=X6MG41_RETFI|nr:hypothetical protein RFI_24722 [Reticulomyxa filosa]|eukprot:ETO12651.1 hypothetical protein RFI_24722 [Reticulomyxa filosa]
MDSVKRNTDDEKRMINFSVSESRYILCHYYCYYCIAIVRIFLKEKKRVVIKKTRKAQHSRPIIMIHADSLAGSRDLMRLEDFKNWSSKKNVINNFNEKFSIHLYFKVFLFENQLYLSYVRLKLKKDKSEKRVFFFLESTSFPKKKKSTIQHISSNLNFDASTQEETNTNNNNNSTGTIQLSTPARNSQGIYENVLCIFFLICLFVLKQVGDNTNNNTDNGTVSGLGSCVAGPDNPKTVGRMQNGNIMNVQFDERGCVSVCVRIVTCLFWERGAEIEGRDVWERTMHGEGHKNYNSKKKNNNQNQSINWKKKKYCTICK